MEYQFGGIHGAPIPHAGTGMNVRSTVVVPDGAAFGFAQRRSWIFSAWWYPAVLAVSGAVHAGLTLFLGQSSETGIVMAILGAVCAALGWTLTAWPRFTRNPPAPASDTPRVKQGIRSTAGMIRTILMVSALGVAALWPLGLAAGLTYTQRLMMNSAELYARWLEHR